MNAKFWICYNSPIVILFVRAKAQFNSHWPKNGSIANSYSLFVFLICFSTLAKDNYDVIFWVFEIEIPVWKIKLAIWSNIFFLLVSYQAILKKWKIMCCIVLEDFFSRFCTGKIDTSQREMVVTNNLGMNAQHFCDHKTPWLMGFTTKTAKGLTLGWSQQYFSHILEGLGPREQGRSGLDCVKILIRRVQNNHRV